MKFEIGISQRAYANRRGVTPKAVRKAIASGRIAAAVLPDNTINPDEADRLWEENTDPTQRRGKEADRAEAAMRARGAEMQASPSERVEDLGDADDDAEDEEPAPRPVPLRPEMFEEDPPRRREADVVSLDAHLAANRARAAGAAPGNRPALSNGDDDGTDPKMLDLALQERAEKVRRLRLANDEKERSLVNLRSAELHVFAFVRAMSEDWQVWPDVFGPDLAAKHGIDQRVLIQDLRDGVRERLKMQSESGKVSLGA